MSKKGFTKSEMTAFWAGASAGQNITIDNIRTMLYSYKPMGAGDAMLGAVIAAQVTENGEKHTAVLCYRREQGNHLYQFWCADKYLENRLTEDEKTKRVAEVLAAHSGSAVLKSRLEASQGVYQESDKCDFWATWRSKQVMCAHVSAFLAYLRDNNPGILDTLQQMYNDADKPSVQDPSTLLTVDELLFQVPVLFEGDRGAGKTHEARAFARVNGFPTVEVGGHAGLESFDLLGSSVPYGPGQFVWKDGPLSKAFRKAQTEKVVLILDELLRIPQRELSILLTAFTPTDEETPKYKLTTGRIVSVKDGIGDEEELVIPAGNLAVVATTNVGGEYAVDAFDPAIAERFVILRRDTNEADLRRILLEQTVKKGFSEDVVEKLMDFFTKMCNAKAQELVHRLPTTRTLVRSLQLAKTKADVVRAVRTQMLLWVERDVDGHPVPEQLESINAVLSNIFT